MTKIFEKNNHNMKYNKEYSNEKRSLYYNNLTLEPKRVFLKFSIFAICLSIYTITTRCETCLSAIK